MRSFWSNALDILYEQECYLAYLKGRDISQ